MPAEPVELYAAEVSLYSGKARAYLRYKQIEFDEILPSRHIIERVLEPATGVRMIPVVRLPGGELVQDTTAIIDRIEATTPRRPVYPVGPRQRLVAHLLELYADEWLLMPAMHYRWVYLRHHLGLLAREFGELYERGRVVLAQPA